MNGAKLAKDPKAFYLAASARGLTSWIPDSVHLKIMFRLSLGTRLDLNNPQTYNEKLQWLKLHDRNPVHTLLVDKFRVKGWVAERIGEEHVTKAIAVWSNVEDIDIGSLPKQFVLKTNHDSGGVVVCRDKADFDASRACDFLGKRLKRNYYWGTREWPYKDVPPLVFAEEYLEEFDSGDLPDYKFFCFNGKVKAMYVISGRFSKEGPKSDYFDAEYNHLPFINKYPNAAATPKKPKHFEEMKRAAEKLSEGIPHVRVDFFETAEGYYFGEMTFFHWSGLVRFEPEEWDYTFGSWIDLSQV